MKSKDLPRNHKFTLFHVPFSPGRTDLIVNDDTLITSEDEARKGCSLRWRVEQSRREIKQTRGIGRRQCRAARIRRNRIARASLGLDTAQVFGL